jgi:hypothetical protein
MIALRSAGFTLLLGHAPGMLSGLELTSFCPVRRGALQPGFLLLFVLHVRAISGQTGLRSARFLCEAPKAFCAK